MNTLGIVYCATLLAAAIAGLIAWRLRVRHAQSEEHRANQEHFDALMEGYEQAGRDMAYYEGKLIARLVEKAKERP